MKIKHVCHTCHRGDQSTFAKLMKGKESEVLSGKHPHHCPCPEGQWESLVKDAELLLESNYLGKGQPLLLWKSWGQGLTRKWFPSLSLLSALVPTWRGYTRVESYITRAFQNEEPRRLGQSFLLSFVERDSGIEISLLPPDLKQEKLLTAWRPGNTRRHQSSCSAFPAGHRGLQSWFCSWGNLTGG